MSEKKRFSERLGITPTKKSKLQDKSMDDALRVAIWNVYSFYLDHIFTTNAPRNIQVIIDLIMLDFFKKSRFSYDFTIRYGDFGSDNFNGVIENTLKTIKNHIENAKWNEVYDFLEHLDDKILHGFATDQVNEAMKKHNSAYRINKEAGLFIRVTETEQITAIEEVQKTPHEIVRAHINKSITLLYDRQKPDYENSIKESISAVETACRIILENDSIILSDALKKLRDKISMHSALNEAFQKIYGYTSDAGGVRHGNKSNSTPATHPEAQFILVACSAFISYLFASDKK